MTSRVGRAHAPEGYSILPNLPTRGTGFRFRTASFTDLYSDNQSTIKHTLSQSDFFPVFRAVSNTTQLHTNNHTHTSFHDHATPAYGNAWKHSDIASNLYR